MGEPGRGTEKFHGFFRLVDACAREGCPVCRCLEDDGLRHLDAILYEQVNDPEMRRRLHGSRGFCNWHTWMLPRVPNSPSGAAILYEDIVGRVLRGTRRLGEGAGPSRPASWFHRLLRLRRRLAPSPADGGREPCPVCVWSARAEASYVGTILRFVDDPQFVRAYAESEGLCLPHLLDAVERGRGVAGLRRLLDRTLPKWEALRSDLERFVGKHDYRNAEPFSEPEASSYERAYRMLAGRRGVYGNDLHRAELELRVRDLATRLADAERRAAALHDRLARVAEEGRALELNLAAERAARALAERALAELRAELERLRAARGPAPGAAARRE